VRKGVEPLACRDKEVDAVDKYRVAEGTRVNLAEWDPADRSEFAGTKGAGEKAANQVNKRLEELQEMLWADRRHRLLVVLQAMDTGGKDGTIRKVFEGVNPVGVRVASFKRPTPPELAHDYLWRVHPHVPGDGEIVVFNRSHYEDVLVVRVHNLVPQSRWEKRYRHLVEFEKLLSDEGTTIVKFFLHISKEEQRVRLQARVDDPTKHWKFSMGDLDERKLWDDYQRAYEDALSETSTAFAPWYIVPADRKWYRDLVVSSVLVEVLEKMELRYPAPEQDVSGVVVE
jgi:PPK2 family polyphosphate:nucleotide phosphotransferase